jgi:hypothetical protein
LVILTQTRADHASSDPEVGAHLWHGGAQGRKEGKVVMVVVMMMVVVLEANTVVATAQERSG